MALKYTLVPMDWVKNKNNAENTSANERPAQSMPTISHVNEDYLHEDQLRNSDSDETKPEPTEIDAIVDMMPKQMARKAKLLVHYIRNQIKLSENGRIVYPDRSLGSHLHDLVKFFVASPMLKIPRPIDAVKFGILLKQIGVPRASLGRDLTLIRSGRGTRHSSSGILQKKNDSNGTAKRLHWKTL